MWRRIIPSQRIERTHGKADKKKEVQRFIESPTALSSVFDRWRRAARRSGRRLWIGGGVVALATAGLFFYRNEVQSARAEAQRELFQAVHYFEAEEWDKALGGDGNSLGFLSIMEDYGSTKAANLAAFYAGNICLKQGNFQRAIEYLSRYESEDFFVQARAYALHGDAYMELEDYKQAITYYEKAARWHPNKIFTPVYLIKLCIARTKMEDLQAAISCYKEIVERYYDTDEYDVAIKEVARLTRLVDAAVQEDSPD